MLEQVLRCHLAATVDGLYKHNLTGLRGGEAVDVTDVHVGCFVADSDQLCHGGAEDKPCNTSGEKQKASRSWRFVPKWLWNPELMSRIERITPIATRIHTAHKAARRTRPSMTPPWTWSDPPSSGGLILGN